MKFLRRLHPLALVAASLLTASAISCSAAEKSAAQLEWERQFQPRSLTTPTPAPAKDVGKVTYTFHRPDKPSAEDLNILREMTEGLDRATECYSRNAPGIRQHLEVFYSPGTPTADGSSNGTIRLGLNSRNQRVCMHEIAHTLGVGTSPQWGKLVVDGIFTGSRATQALREITGDEKAVLHADRMHFWPYGLNYDTEVKSPDDFVAHCKIVTAIVRDLKLAR